ncbi:MAG: hypothetical protein ACHP9Z_29085 [Streptosporangiales bacterium]
MALTYVSANQERWFATTEEHPDLVEMVNQVKTQAGDAPNGPFYINEHGQVIVPVGPSATYYLAGEYDMPLRFEFEGKTLSGDGVDHEGRPLEPGDLWTGPHPGIPYRLKAGQRDVYYRAFPRPGVETRPQLSASVGPGAAAAFAGRIQQVKGWQGGRFYVNEWREIFAPVPNDDGLEYRYIGHLELDEPWFPKTTGDSV